jgi:hypothetical protein
MGFNSRLFLVKDGPDSQIAFEIFKGLFDLSQ